MTFKIGSARAVVLGLTAVMAACESSPTSPTANNSQFGIGGGSSVVATVADPGLPQGTVTLKATAPDLMSPADGVVVNDPAVVLTVSSPAAVYLPWAFLVRYELYELSNPSVPVHAAEVVQGAGSTSYPIPANVLQDLTQYVWRAQARTSGADGPWSTVFGFTTEFAKIENPTPLLPIGGIVVNSLRPAFTVKNGASTGDVGTVLAEIELSRDQTFSSVDEILRTHTRARGETNLFLQNDLLPNTQYHWRTRSTNRNLPETSVLPVGSTVIKITTDWSESVTFRTPTAAAAAPAPPTGGGSGGPPPGTGGCCPPPNRLAVVLQVAAETGYPNSGINVTDFTQIVASRLAQEDPNWGRRINDAGPLGKDTVAYRVGGQNDNPYSIDIVSGATTSNPIPHWHPHGHVGGSWTPAN